MTEAVEQAFDEVVRWSGQATAADDGALPGLGPAGALASSIPGLQRTVRPPAFAGMTFHEVRARSVLNAVPADSSMPFRWTVNPYRGCSHACVYCFARGTHAWLDLDTGEGFDREVVVKTDVAQVLRRELARPSWAREHVALGTGTDPYQRAEGRYALMPGVVAALAGSGTPFSVLTKGTLLARDLPLLAAASREVPVGVGVSLAVWDERLHAALEPGTPSPHARLELVRRARAAGLPCGVFVAPVLPWLTDGEDHLDEAVGRVAAAGATGVTVVPLHLRPGAREWFLAWLAREHPALVPRYRDLYGRGAYVPAAYRTWLSERLAPVLERHGLAGRGGALRRPDEVVDDGGGASFPAGSMPTSRARPTSDPAPAPVPADQLDLGL